MLRSLLALCCAVGVSGFPAQAAGPFEELLRSAPPNSNVIALIDVAGALASPLAQKERWLEKGQPGNRGGLGFVPNDARQVVIAAEVNLNSFVRTFQVGLVRVRNVPTMNQLASQEGGTQDEIAGRLAVLSPRNVYFTTLSGQELAAVFPADRQQTARWIRAARAAKGPSLSPYLQAAADAAGGNTVTIAVDLQDVVDRNILRLSLAASPSVARQKDLDVANLAAFLAQARGLTFTAKVDDAITGTLSVEFALEPARQRRILPDLILELIDGQGVWIPGIEKWTITYTDSAINFTGPMTTLDLKRVVSLFAFPQAGLDEAMMKGEEVSVPATKRYLSAVETILNDISNTRESPNYERMATWHEKAAAQIEQLSRRGVDPIATEAALQSAKRLRAIGASLRGVPIDIRELESQQYSFSNAQIAMMPGGWWGWHPTLFLPTHTTTNVPQIQAQIRQVIADDQKRRSEAWSQINRLMGDAKQKLAEKHKTPF
jgi:hypothetical protein